MPFQKGQSGNPKGRLPGTITKTAGLRRQIEASVPGIVEVLTEKALAGDVPAAKLLMERALPPLKAEAPTIQLPGLADQELTTAARAVIAAVGAGTLSPDTGGQLVQALVNAVRLIESAELAERIKVLEDRANDIRQ